MLRFDPPENAIYAEKQPSKGHVSVGWQLLDKWKGARGYREIARDLGCSAGLLTTWKQGRTPATHYLEKLEQLADVPPIAWKHWICVDPAKEFDPDAPISIEKIRAAEDYMRQDPEGYGCFATDLQLCRALLAARPGCLENEHLTEDTIGLRMIDAALKHWGSAARVILIDRQIELARQTRGMNAA